MLLFCHDLDSRFWTADFLIMFTTFITLTLIGARVNDYQNMAVTVVSIKVFHDAGYCTTSSPHQIRLWLVSLYTWRIWCERLHSCWKLLAVLGSAIFEFSWAISLEILFGNLIWFTVVPFSEGNRANTVSIHLRMTTETVSPDDRSNSQSNPFAVTVRAVSERDLVSDITVISS